MKKTTLFRIKALLDRIARVSASQDWIDNLNPAQRGALTYLANANQFSRAPSNIAEYMCTTRGTASQTLKALERKGLVSQSQSPADKRSISYDVTAAGQKAIENNTELDIVLSSLGQQEGSALAGSLEKLSRELIVQRGYKAFGICSECIYHKKSSKGLFCSLLSVELSQDQSTKLCHEYVAK